MPDLRHAVLALALFAAGCSTTRSRTPQTGYELPDPPPRRPSRLVQGMLGITDADSVDVELDGPTDEIRDDGTDTFGMIGGAWQQALRAGAVDVGYEFGFTASFDSGRGAVAVNNGALLVASEIDALFIDGFVGVYLGARLGDRVRLYGGAGPVLQYGEIKVDYVDQANAGVRVDDSGFGGGVYARAGIEYRMPNGTLVGLGVRRLDSRVDFGSGGFDEIDFEATQAFITVTRIF